MRKLVATIIMASLSLVSLTACSVSDKERQACESGGGHVVSEAFQTGRKGFWGRETTNRMTYCKVNNAIERVFHDAVTPEKVSGKKQSWATECQDEGGTLYEVKYHRKVGKIYTTRYDYLCVAQGQVVVTHLHGDSK